MPPNNTNPLTPQQPLQPTIVNPPINPLSQTTIPTPDQKKYAGFWVRFTAIFFDIFIVLFIVFIIVYPLVKLGILPTAMKNGMPNIVIGNNSPTNNFVVALFWIIATIYGVVMTALFGQTLGKKALGIRVTVCTLKYPTLILLRTD